MRRILRKNRRKVAKWTPEVREPRSEQVRFVLAQSPEMRAREVVARAREQGIIMTEQRVYAVRYLAKHPSPPRVVKAEFVLQLPEDLPAREVVARGRENGIELREAQVHNIRSSARLKQGLPKRRAGRKPNVPRPPQLEWTNIARVPALPLGRVKKGRSGAVRDTARGLVDLERELRRRIAELGIQRSRELLAELDRTFAPR